MSAASPDGALPVTPPPVNRHRGEVGAVLGGRPYRLCLTLGALAELEDALGAENLAGIAERFAGGRVAARDLIHVIRAGLRGGGHDIATEEIAAMRIEGGATAQVRLCAELLAATFADEPGERAPGGNAQ